MAYTRAWTKNNPPGGQAANTTDDEIRNLREDTEERMAAIVTGWTTGAPTDPIVPLPQILGNVNGKRLHLHHSDFIAHSATNESRNSQYMAPSGNGTFGFWAPLKIPVGCTVQSIFGLFDRQTKPITIAWGYIDAVTGAATVLGTVTDNVTAAVFQKSIAAGFPHVIVTARFYFVEVDLDGQSVGGFFARCYGAFANYDTPDCRNTQ